MLLSWKETRAKISKEKLSPGFPTRQDVKKLEARVRCFKCKAVGHFSKNCAKRGSSSSTSSPGKSGVKVNFVNMVSSSSDSKTQSIVDEYDMIEYDETDQVTEHEIDVMVHEWADRRKDFWKTKNEQVIRVHVLPRRNLFTPMRTQCPVSVEELSTARLTKVKPTQDGRSATEVFTANWKHSGECHRDLGYEWTGETVFYKDKAVIYESPEQEETEEEIDGVAAVLMDLMRQYHGGQAFQVRSDPGDWVDLQEDTSTEETIAAYADAFREVQLMAQEPNANMKDPEGPRDHRADGEDSSSDGEHDVQFSGQQPCLTPEWLLTPDVDVDSLELTHFKDIEAFWRPRTSRSLTWQIRSRFSAMETAAWMRQLEEWRYQFSSRADSSG